MSLAIEAIFFENRLSVVYFRPQIDEYPKYRRRDVRGM
jgi:hypothetical protein